MNHRCVSRVRGIWSAGRWWVFVGLVGTLLVRREGVGQAAPERVSVWVVGRARGRLGWEAPGMFEEQQQEAG